MGTLGFLTPFEPEEMAGAVAAALAGGCIVEERPRLHVQLLTPPLGAGEPVSGRAPTAGPGTGSIPSGGPDTGSAAVGPVAASALFLNELCLMSPVPGREPAPRLEVLVDGVRLPEFGGEGLIVATSTGSTAYNLSAGGPIVAPAVPGTVITPINGSRRSRPRVVRSDAVIEIRALRPVGHASISQSLPVDRVLVDVDGRVAGELHAGSRLLISRSEAPLLSLSSRDPLQTWMDDVRQVLLWNIAPQRVRHVGGRDIVHSKQPGH